MRRTVLNLLLLGCAHGFPSRDALLWVAYEFPSGAPEVVGLACSGSETVERRQLDALAENADVWKVAVAAREARETVALWVTPYPGENVVIRRAIATHIAADDHDGLVLLVLPLRDGSQEFDRNETALRAHLVVCASAMHLAVIRDRPASRHSEVPVGDGS